ncbi:hypothetical protein MJ575_07595 [Klebsiella pneumoniae]|nr:hypothetical protein MJ575_07595 [Klebsiella pneumoniae]
MRGGCELTNNALNAVDTIIINRVYRFNPINIISAAFALSLHVNHPE